MVDTWIARQRGSARVGMADFGGDERIGRSDRGGPARRNRRENLNHKRDQKDRNELLPTPSHDFP